MNEDRMIYCDYCGIYFSYDDPDVFGSEAAFGDGTTGVFAICPECGEFVPLACLY